MAIIFPIFSFFILSLALNKNFINSRRESCLVSAIVCSMWLWLVTETLSFFQILNFKAVLSAWIIFLIGTGVLLLKTIRISRKKIPLKLALVPIDAIILMGISLVLLGTLLLALVSPPNTWDALTYHMSRVVHWVQNGSLAPYPTYILRQIFSNPGFEYFVLHFYLLAKGDAWVNLVQWLAMLGSLMVISMIARQLGASRRGQLLAVIVASTIPMGIVESSSLQGDYMVAFFVVAAVYAFLKWRLDPSWSWAILLGSSFGLAILAKGTGIFFILPVLMGFVGLAVFYGSRLRWQQVLVVIFLVGIINAGFVLRTVLYFPGKALTEVTQEGRGVLNEALEPGIFLINALRHSGTHMGTSSERLNKTITQGMRSLSMMIGANIDDPRATYGSAHFAINKPTRDENATSAGVHFILSIIFVLWVFFSPVVSRELRWYGACLLSMAIVFCLSVKWQPWLSRLQLPLFVLASAGIGVFLERIRIAWVPMVIVTLLFIFAIPYVINAYPRHLVGKKNVFMQTHEEQYFSMVKERYPSYAKVSDRLAASGCHDIGLVIGSDDWEYPLWPLLQDRGMTNFRLEHIDTIGPLSHLRYPLGDFNPCARVVVKGSVADVTF